MKQQIPNDLFFAWVESELAEGRRARFRLKGSSMFPLIREGCDEVMIRPCTEDELHPMDVVLFRYRGKHVLHRILRKEGHRLLLQGDGSYVAREQCTTADVVGKLDEVIRPSGRSVSVTDWQWRLSGRIWRNTGPFRGLLLRVLHRLW